MALPLTNCSHGGVNCSCVLPSTSGKERQYPAGAVRALPIRILTVGKKRSPGVQLLVDEYIGKLRNYCHVDDVIIRSNPRNTRDVRAQVDDEDEAIMKLIGSDDWVVMLDERGVDMGSEQLAGLLGNAGNTGASRLSFCIGGPYGLGRQVRQRADISIKLSSMVLNHQIALVVLMEQLYRCNEILWGEIHSSMVIEFCQVLDDSQRPEVPSFLKTRPSLVSQTEEVPTSPLNMKYDVELGQELHVLLGLWDAQGSLISASTEVKGDN